MGIHKIHARSVLLPPPLLVVPETPAKLTLIQSWAAWIKGMRRNQVIISPPREGLEDCHPEDSMVAEVESARLFQTGAPTMEEPEMNRSESRRSHQAIFAGCRQICKLSDSAGSSQPQEEEHQPSVYLEPGSVCRRHANRCCPHPHTHAHHSSHSTR